MIDNNMTEYLSWMYHKLRFKSFLDWKHVTDSQFKKLGGVSLLNRYGSLAMLLTDIYPVECASLKLSYNDLKPQQLLYITIRDIVTSDCDVYPAYQHPTLRSSKEDRSGITLDVYVPSLRLSFDWKDEHWGRWEVERSKLKKELCAANGLTLIEIPYWWDKKKE